MSLPFTFPRILGSTVAFVAALTASSAVAQSVKVLIIDVDGAPHCDTASGCTAVGTTCDTPPGTTCVSLPLPGTSRPQPTCVAPALVRYCCMGPDDCPRVDGVAGRCIPPTVGDSSFGHGLCAYTPVNACLGALMRTDAEAVRRCFRTTEGLATDPYGTVPFGSGDCDGDGIANMDEMEACLCNPENTCTNPDGGVPVENDAGIEPDLGPVDAPIDFGPPDIDANLPPGTGLDFRGAGGCACEAGSTRGARGGPLGALIVLGGLLSLRARRRVRGRSARLSA